MIQNLISLGGLGKLRNRLTPLSGVPVLLPGDVGGSIAIVQESSVIVEATGYKVYFTGSNSAGTDIRIYMATCDSLAGTWTVNPTAIIGMGNGGAPAGRMANCSYVFKLGGYYYCLAADGYGSGTSNVFLYRSADGITSWGDLGLLIDKTSLGASLCGNTSVYPVLVNGQYHMLLEAFRDGYWQIFRLTSTNIESGWVVANTIPGLQVVTGGMYGGTHHFYLNNKWYIFYHYGADGSNGGNFPTYLAWATSDDLVTVQKKETPLFALEAMPYTNTNQNADPFIVQGNDGRCYLLSEYEQNASPAAAQLWMWTFNGTMQQLLANT